MTEFAQQAAGGQTAIRPFHVEIPEAALTELRRRIHATIWPERETGRMTQGKMSHSEDARGLFRLLLSLP